MKQRNSPPSPSPEEIETQLARGLRGTSPDLEARFEALQARLRVEASEQAKTVWFPRGFARVSLAAAAALTFALISLPWLAQPPTGDSTAFADAVLSPVHLQEMLALDATLQPARLLLDTELLLAFMEMPYENNSH